LSFSRL
jgi:hypothetical protein